MERKKQQTYLLFFIYSTPFINLAVNGTNSATLTIQADSDFHANYMTVTVRQADLIVDNWGGTIDIDDTGKGRHLTNTPVAVDSVGGNGRLPYPFNPTRIFSANSSIVITLQNNIAIETEVQVQFHGNKILAVSAG